MDLRAFKCRNSHLFSFFFSRQVLAAVDLSPIPLPAKTYCTGPCLCVPGQTGFPQIFGSILGEKCAGWDTELWCDVSSVLHRLDVGRKWCVVQAEEEKRETWGVEWVNVCTLFDVSADLEHSRGWIPWLLISDLSTGFCKCAKGINSVYGSTSESSAAILLSLEGWDTVHLYLSCYFWLSIIWGH